MKQKKHVIAMLVEDQPGVLTRIAGMFARRGFNIDTITVGKTTRTGKLLKIFEECKQAILSPIMQKPPFKITCDPTPVSSPLASLP